MKKIGKEFIRENVRFLVCSLIGTGIDYLVLYTLKGEVGEEVANRISYAVGVLVTFFLCRKFVFENNDNVGRRLISSIIVHAIGWHIQSVFFDYLLHRFGSIMTAKIGSTLENAVVMYFLNKFVIFRKYKEKKEQASED